MSIGKSLQGVVFQGEVGTALVIKADESQTWCWDLLLIRAASVCRLLEKKRSHPNLVSGDRIWRRPAQFLHERIPAHQQVPGPQEHRVRETKEPVSSQEMVQVQSEERRGFATVHPSVCPAPSPQSSRQCPGHPEGVLRDQWCLPVGGDKAAGSSKPSALHLLMPPRALPPPDPAFLKPWEPCSLGGRGPSSCFRRVHPGLVSVLQSGQCFQGELGAQSASS